MAIRFLMITAVMAVFAAACSPGGRPTSDPTSYPAASAHSSGATSGSPPPASGAAGPDPTSVPTSSTTTGVSPPVLPPAAKQHDTLGALAFTGYFFQAFNWGYRTGDPTLITTLAAPSCDSCRRYAESLRSLAGQSGRIVGGDVTVTSFDIATGTFSVKSDVVVEARINEQPTIILRPDSGPSTAAPAVRAESALVFLSWGPSGWEIEEVGLPS